MIFEPKMAPELKEPPIPPAWQGLSDIALIRLNIFANQHLGILTLDRLTLIRATILVDQKKEDGYKKCYMSFFYYYIPIFTHLIQLWSYIQPGIFIHL